MDPLTEAKRIPLDDADFATLKHYAEMALGIEVKTGTNAASLRAKILAAVPNLKDVPPLPAPAAPVAAAQPINEIPREIIERAMAGGYHAETENPALRPAAVSPRPSLALRNPKADPKVSLTINRTTDKFRPREVTVEVNGTTWRMRRGEKIEVPLRVYFALNDAVEKQPVETDEINKFTGEPVMGFEDVHSYPFMVHSMPSKEEIAAWRAATDSGFDNANAPI